MNKKIVLISTKNLSNRKEKNIDKDVLFNKLYNSLYKYYYNSSK